MRLDRTLVIPDVHEDIDQVEKILNHAGWYGGQIDHRVFLGDFFDTYGPKPDGVQRTAKFLEENIKCPNSTFIFGNHDLPYAYPLIRGLRCSGFDSFKLTIVAKAMELARQHFKLTTEVQGWRLSHAGFNDVTNVKLVDHEAMGALGELAGGRMPWLLRVGYSRGGDSPNGGVTWLDWDDEFVPVDGLKQIVGHTRHKEPQWKGDNLALDTGLHHYALIEDGKVTTVEV